MDKIMNLEDSVKGLISQKLTDGTIEKLISEKFENGINAALNDLFGNYGDVTKIIEKKIKSVMIPYLENHDYSEYITKLDYVLVEILKNTTLDNKKVLENFKSLISETETPIGKEIKASEIFEEYKNFVAKEVKTDGLEVNTDDGSPRYQSVTVTLKIEEDEKRSWSSFMNAKLFLECEHDEEMNFELSIWKNKDDKTWNIRADSEHSLRSLRYLKSFDMYLLKLFQADPSLIVDDTDIEDDVEPEAEPECDWS